jgi:hypothetical protein
MFTHVIIQFVGGPKDGLVLHSDRIDEVKKANEYFAATTQGTVSATLNFPNGPERPHIVEDHDYTNKPVPVRNDVYTVASSTDDVAGVYKTVVLTYTNTVTV